MRVPALLATAMLLTATACGGYPEGGTIVPEDSPGTSSSGGASSSETPSAGSEPDIGDGPMRVGQVRRNDVHVTTLEEVRNPYPGEGAREPEKAGHQFLGLRLRQCLSDGAASSPDWDYYSTSNGEWYAVRPNGNRVRGTGSYWPDWPTPKFPENVTMTPGECLEGWLVLEVPSGMKVDEVVWRSSGAVSAERLP